MLLVVSCTPKTASEGSNCDPGLMFDKSTRSCITDPTPQLPIATTSLISIEQDSAESFHDISYNNFDGDNVLSCSITSSTGGLRGTLKHDGVIYRALVSNLNGINYELNIVNDNFIIAGFENVSLSGNTITVRIREGETTSNQIASAINSDATVGLIMTATVSESVVLQTELSTSSFQGAYCDCINGQCRVYIQPVTGYVGTSRLTYTLTDDDGTSDPQTISVEISDKDDAPVTQDIAATGPYYEDVVGTVFLREGPLATDAYTDADGDDATSCTTSNLTGGISIISSCACVTGICYVQFQGASNASGPFSFDYTVSSNGLTSNTSTVSGMINAVNDLPTGSSISYDLNEEGLNGTSTNLSVTIPTGSDVETSAGALYYQYVSHDIPAALMPALPTDCLIGTTDSRTACSFIFDDEFNSYNGQTFSVVYKVVDGDSGESSNYTISIRFLETNDPPKNYGVADPVANFTFEESPTWDLSDTTSVTWNSTLGGWDVNLASYAGADVEDDANSVNLSYYIAPDADPDGIVSTDGTGSAGTLSHCMNLSGSDGLSDLTCLYTPSNANATTTGADTFYYVVRDSGGLYGDDNDDGDDNAVSFTITVNDNSDLPALCQFSTYSEKKSRYECGLGDCIGDGAPGFLPTSHTTESPLVYIDQSNGYCYQSTSTATFTRISSSIPDQKVGEGETIVISNIAINEGGDVSEDTENIHLNLDSSSLTISNTDLIKAENITFYWDSNGDGDYADGNDSTINNSFSVQELGVATDVAGDGRLKIEILPTSGETGSSTITFNICDTETTAITCLDTEVSFSVTVEPVSVSHGGWTKIKSSGVRSKITGTAIDQNLNCPYSLAKCDGGKPCYTSSSTTPNVEADIKGAIFKTSNACYVAKDLTSSGTTWEAITPFCAVTEVKNLSSNLRYNCTITGTDCEDSSGSDVACSGVSSGYPALTPKSLGTYYKDGSGVCYRAQTAMDATSWVVADLYQSDATNDCDTNLGGSCIGEGTPDASGLNLTAVDGTYYYDYQTGVSDSKRCWVYDSGWKNYPSVNEITIAWDAFAVSGAGAITGYNVYRRIPGEDFDYENPINLNTVSIVSNEFVDNGTNSRVPAAPGQVYYYEVRPIVDLGSSNTIEIQSNSSINELRLVSAPANQVFVHRWMMNKQACDLMNSTINRDRDYACPYVGYGDVNVTLRAPAESQLFGSDTVFDVERDLLVNKNEVGCPYTAIGCSNTQDGSCIGDDTPDNLSVGGSDGDFYYNRSAGTCYYRSGGSWAAYDGTVDLDNDSSSQYGDGFSSFLPPLANVDFIEANATCSNQTTPDVSGLTVSAFRLPSRLEQVAYSRWEFTNSFDDSDASVIEEGLAMNASQKCNSSSANGIDSAYVDGVLPLSSSRYSLPGTLSSSIRSVYTGSEQTSDCVSMFGVQDAIGNLSEWVDLRFSMDKTTNSEIRMTYASGISQSTTDGGVTTVFDNNDYQFDGDIGPCADLNTDGDCESDISPWLFETTSTYDADYFLIPWGLPIADKFLTDNPSDGALNYVAQIGSSGGITNNQLKDDALSVTTTSIADGSTLGSAVGGSFTSGGGAGVYSLFLTPTTFKSYEVGTRCVITIDDSDYSN